MADKPNLLPCVFCGDNDLHLMDDGWDYAHIECMECLARGPSMDQVGDWTRAYTAWNTRAVVADTNGEPE